MSDRHTYAPIDATRWRLDSTASSVAFRVPHFWGLVSVKGRFERLDGWLETGEDGERKMELIVDAASLTTRNRRRDKHLRSADFFDVERHPEIRFRASAVGGAAENDRLRVEGQLAVAGERVELTLEPTLRRVEERLFLDVRASVDQRELGMTWSPLGMTRSPATVVVHAQLRREPRFD